MKTLKEKLNHFVYPNIKWVYASAIITILLWVLLIGFKLYNTWYFLTPVIVFSIYAGVIVSFSIPQIYTEIMDLLNSNKWISMFLNDVNVRMFATTYMNLNISALYAVLNFYNGFVLESNWQMAIALYYMVLTMARFYLLAYINKSDTRSDKKAGEKMLSDLKKYRMTGWFLLIILIPLVWIMAQMLEENATYTYSGFMLYAMILFNIYVWVLVIYGQMMYGKVDNPILTSTRAIALACALVSTLALETAILAHTGFEVGLLSREVIIALSGMTMCIIIFCIGVHMIARAHSILSLNYVPRKYREKVSLKEKRKARKETYAEDKRRYEEYMKENWEELVSK